MPATTLEPGSITDSLPPEDSPGLDSSTSRTDAAQEMDGQQALSQQIRGSSLLIAGKGVALVLNLIAQVVTIRYLSRGDFGLIAWSFSMVEVVSLLMLCGIDKSLSRFAAIYHQKKRAAEFRGSIVLTFGWAVGFGAILSIAILAGESTLIRLTGVSPEAGPVLQFLAVLIPVNAGTSVCLSIYAVLGKTRTVFLRRQLLSPILRLAAVGVAIVLNSGLMGVAIAWLVSGIVNLLLDGGMTYAILIKDSVFRTGHSLRLKSVARDLFSYGIPMLTSDVAFMIRGSLLVLLLGWLSTTDAAASYRAVLPFVRLNELVLLNFLLLFTPLASRLFAGNQNEELAGLFRSAAVWALVLSFPIFAGCVMLSHHLTAALFGTEYLDAADLLIVLSLGYLLQVAFGFNSRILKVQGHLRIFVMLDIGAIVASLAMSAILIPRYAAFGAALAVTGGIIVHSFGHFYAVRSINGWSPWTSKSQGLFALTAVVSTGLVTLQLFSPQSLPVALAIIFGSSLLIAVAARPCLNAGTFFPEIRRLPLIRHFLSVSHTMTTAARHNHTRSVQRDSTSVIPLSAGGRHNAGGHRQGSLRIGYIMSRFPKITETFVLFEMREMERRGHHVEVFPLQRERTSVVHNDAAHFVRKAHFTLWISPAILAANLRTFQQHPLRYIATFGTLVRANLGSARFLAGAIAFFPKAVWMSRQVQNLKLDIIHAHFASHPAAVAWVIHRLTGIPFTFTAHGSDLHRDQHMLKQKVRDASAVITISDYNRRIIIDHCGTGAEDRVHVVHCGVTNEALSLRRHPTEFDSGRGQMQVVCIGTLHEVKGQVYLIDAMATLRKHGISMQCTFVGDGPDDSRLKNRVRSLALEDAVRFTGRLRSDEIQEILANSDVLAAPSVPTTDGRREGIPVVLMEAMAAGVAVVASRLSGIPEIVRHNETGLLTECRDSDSIADALRRLDGSAELRQRLASAGRQLVEREFTISTNVETLVSLLSEAVSENSAVASFSPLAGMAGGR